MNWPRESEMERFYGKRGQNQTSIVPPYPMALSWNQSAVKRITCHEKAANSLTRVLQKVRDEYGVEQISKLGLDQFSGCLNVRLKRGSKSSWSIHSWGCALDFDDENNRLKWKKPQARFSAKAYIPWWKCWESEGWVSLGRVKDFDWQHVQAARL